MIRVSACYGRRVASSRESRQRQENRNATSLDHQSRKGYATVYELRVSPIPILGGNENGEIIRVKFDPYRYPYSVSVSPPSFPSLNLLFSSRS